MERLLDDARRRPILKDVESLSFTNIPVFTFLSHVSLQLTVTCFIKHSNEMETEWNGIETKRNLKINAVEALRVEA